LLAGLSPATYPEDPLQHCRLTRPKRRLGVRQLLRLVEHDAYQVAPKHLEFLANFKDWWKQVQVKDLA